MRSKIFINPLSSLKESFYKGGILFSCLYDTKRKEVFAAGGRYDGLIREYRPRIGSQTQDRHAVGFCLSWEKLTSSMTRFQKTGSKAFLKKGEEEASRGLAQQRVRLSHEDARKLKVERMKLTQEKCDVLVASFDASILRSEGIDILQQLWANDISAELAVDSRAPEDILSKYRDDQHYWIVIIKQDLTAKIKCTSRKEVQDVDLPLSQLVSWMRNEIRERDQRDGIFDKAKLPRHISQADGNMVPQKEQEVRVHLPQTKSKKSTRKHIVEQAQARVGSFVRSLLDGTIATIDTTDQIMELIRETRLSDAETWKRVSQSVPHGEKRYISEVHDMLIKLAIEKKNITRHGFVHNSRTGLVIPYDWGA